MEKPSLCKVIILYNVDYDTGFPQKSKAKPVI